MDLVGRVGRYFTDLDIDYRSQTFSSSRAHFYRSYTFSSYIHPHFRVCVPVLSSCERPLRDFLNV